MEAGRLKESVKFVSPPTGQDEYGAPNTDWVDVLTTRASFVPMIGREWFQAEATQSMVEVKFRIRYRKEITNKMRLINRGITYEILSASNVEGQNREILLYCKKVANQ